MKDQLLVNIKTHLDTFPEHVREIDEMKKEWKEFKTWFFWAMISFTTFAVGYGIWVGTIQSEFAHLTDEVDKNTASQEVAETRLNNLEVNNSEIKSRLTSIEVTLQEIKTAIIKLQ